MKVIHYTEAKYKKFEADGVKGVTGRVVIGQADGAKNFCMRVFELAECGYSPCHAHDWEHEIFILQQSSLGPSRGRRASPSKRHSSRRPARGAAPIAAGECTP